MCAPPPPSLRLGTSPARAGEGADFSHLPGAGGRSVAAGEPGAEEVEDVLDVFGSGVVVVGGLDPWAEPGRREEAEDILDGDDAVVVVDRQLPQPEGTAADGAVAAR